MVKKYFEVEMQYTGTKTFHVKIDDTMGEQETLKYIAENYRRLERDYNPKGEYMETAVLAIICREEEQ